MATGGKPYYLAGLLPALIGAGASPVDTWMDGGRRRTRRAVLGAALAISAVAGALIALPVLPARDAVPDRRGQPGRRRDDRLARPGPTVADVRHRLPRTAHPVILTEQLRRGRRDRPLRAGDGTAPRLQRAQRLRNVGPTARSDPAGDRRRLRPHLAGRAPARLHHRGPHQQHSRRRQRRARRAGPDLPGSARIMGTGMARPVTPWLTIDDPYWLRSPSIAATCIGVVPRKSPRQ